MSKYISYLIFGFLIVLLGACSSEVETSADKTVEEKQIDTTEDGDCTEEGQRDGCWTVQVPNIGNVEKVPLVVDLHGFNGTDEGQRSSSGFAEISEEEGFVVAWPIGVAKSWNAGELCCGTAVATEIDDVAFLTNMVNELTEELDFIDTNQIYFTGFSNGCAMAQRMAIEASELVDGVACMGHYKIVPNNDNYTAVPVMEIHGVEDSVVDYSKADENFEEWVALNGCRDDAIETVGDGYKVLSNSDCNLGANVSFVSIEGAGHNVYKSSGTEVDTTKIAWDFLNSIDVE